MIKSCTETTNLIDYKNSLLIYNILRDLGLIPTLKGTKLLNKAIQIAIKSNEEFIVIEDIYKQVASSYEGFNSVQIRNAIKYAIDNRNEQKSINNFENIFGYKYDSYCFTNKIMIEEIARVIQNRCVVYSKIK